MAILFPNFRSGEGLGCNVNPQIGRPRLGPTSHALRVLVAGGGPAGMWATLYLAKRGHIVTLVEKEDCLGAPPHRQATESLVPIDRTDTSTPKSSDPSSDRSGNEGRQAMRRPRSRSTGPRGGKGNCGLRRYGACSQPWATQRRGIAPVPPVSVLSLHDSRKAEQRADPVLPLVATVDTDKCIGCGTCEEVCPIGAISVAQVAKTDPKRCQGCGLCVTACPAGAISMRPMRLPDKQSASG